MFRPIASPDERCMSLLSLIVVPLSTISEYLYEFLPCTFYRPRHFHSLIFSQPLLFQLALLSFYPLFPLVFRYYFLLQTRLDVFYGLFPTSFPSFRFNFKCSGASPRRRGGGMKMPAAAIEESSLSRPDVADISRTTRLFDNGIITRMTFSSTLSWFSIYRYRGGRTNFVGVTYARPGFILPFYSFFLRQPLGNLRKNENA